MAQSVAVLTWGMMANGLSQQAPIAEAHELKLGDTAPLFELPSHLGGKVALKDLLEAAKGLKQQWCGQITAKGARHRGAVRAAQPYANHMAPIKANGPGVAMPI